MNSLSVKLSLLFAGLALLSIGALAVWVNQTVNTNFTSYCQQHDTVCMCAHPETGVKGLGQAEQDFLQDSQRSLGIAAFIAIVVAVALGIIVSILVTRPMRELAASAGKVASGDLSQRVKHRSDDEVGEVSAAFNTMAEQLEMKEKSRKQLLADVAHELRNPLSIVQGNLEAWLDGVIAPTPEQIAPVYDETVLLNRLITDLRELSLAEAGQLKLVLEDTDLSELINAEVAVFQARCQEKGVSLDAGPAVGLPRINIDAGRIRQVLHNLLENALHFSATGGSIRVSAVKEKNDGVVISVSDTGSGIDPADLPHVFDHFYKADRARQRSYGGAGIGLALVRKYVELHGGKIWVESQPGKGSKFSFSLPAA
ncbi:MAG: HAMP domain-containing sensor histidine kinase [Dehalococcoidia bacterium]|nr:HAMP domain-containing sensor histidine kinase [Dehalococcoidia bacterium]